MDEALGAVLLESTEALEGLGLPYAIVGGLAVSVWAIPRRAGYCCAVAAVVWLRQPQPCR